MQKIGNRNFFLAEEWGKTLGISKQMSRKYCQWGIEGAIPVGEGKGKTWLVEVGTPDPRKRKRKQ